VVDEIDRLGYGDNTLIFYIWGDNGSSAEGQGGTISELLAQNGIPSAIGQHMAALEDLGGLDALGSPKTDNMYHAGWAWAGSTPYKGTKLLASHFGGTRNPMDQARCGPVAAIPSRKRRRADDLRARRHYTKTR
jgi:arylsulfatase A-like enzyme